MTTALVIAALLALWKLSDFGRFEHICTQCQGRGKHRKDCPYGDDE